ncbi:hypothetical protein [Aeoliella mucimassa]|uniref:hypothetical protein n=1 Tax=Aeoliella mucimassa TaxID=2527972 RepID=UPI0011A6C298|nr:hypothetical protein [Aeoliella mucimassa]
MKPRNDPRQVEPVNQITIIDEAGKQHSIELHEGMTAKTLSAKIKKLGIRNFRSIYCSVTEQSDNSCRDLLREAFPGMVFEDLPDSEPGESTVKGRIRFEYSTEADRAIAKIAFHYYLIHNQRGFDGSEPEFAAIRQYLWQGGDSTLFFNQAGPSFELPFGEDPSGVVRTPSNWCHVLLAHEVDAQVVVYMRLFAGPEHVGEEYHVTLGSIEGRIVLPSGTWGHIYHYDEERNDNYSGHIQSIKPEQLR